MRVRLPPQVERVAPDLKEDPRASEPIGKCWEILSLWETGRSFLRSVAQPLEHVVRSLRWLSALNCHDVSPPTLPTAPYPMTMSSAHRRDYSDSPLLLTWETTQACALTCEHCRADAQPERHPDELSTAEAEGLIDAISGFEQPPILVLSGGDPLERPDLFHLIAYAIDSGLPTAITPAPTGNLKPATVERFADLGISRMALSLDGATAAIHDEFRGEPGSYDAIMRAAEAAREFGVSLQINTTVTAATAPDLPGIANLVEALGAVMWEVFFLVPIGRGRSLESLPPEHSERVMAWLYRRQRGAPFRVITVEAPHYRRVAAEIQAEEIGDTHPVGSTRAGRGFLFVSHTGEVYPSGFLPVSVGNVREVDPVHLYRTAPLLRRLRDTDRFHGECGRCRYRETCGGSRSRAYATTGNPFESDPLCPLVAGKSKR